MSDFDFQDYLSAIALHYGQQRDLYTLTDALLPLEARSVEREEAGQEKRVEQFPVLAGLRRFALGDEREHVLLAGRPGSGKSTALRQLVVELAEEGLVPVLVQLKGDRAVPELIKAEFRARKVRVTDEQIEDWLVADRLILLLDGVNEMPTEELRRSLAQFREDNRTVPMIFTTRDLSLGGDLGIGKRLEMKPLSEGQLREFVGKYLPEQGEKLLGQLRDRLREIAETPLLLKMLCDVFRQTGEIPPNKGELFRLFDREYEKFKSLPAVSADFRRFKSEILQHLAFVMMQGDESKPTEFWLTIARSQAERSIEQCLTGRVSDPGIRAKEWLEDLLEHHLLQVAADSRQVEFHHQLFQEYYAAEALLGMFADRHPDVVEPERFKHLYLNYLKWTESMAIVLSLMDDEETAVDLVKQALDVDLMLGARLAGDLSCRIKSTNLNLENILKANKLSQIISTLQQKKDPHLENFYNRSSDKDEMDQKSIYLELIRDLNSDYEDLEIAIVMLCDYKNDLEVIKELRLFLDHEKRSEDLKALSLRSLSIIGYQISYIEFAKILAGHNYLAIPLAIESFGVIKCKQALPQLINLLGSTEDYVVLSAIIPALLKIDYLSTSHYVEEYLRKLEMEHQELDNFEKFQIYNRFLSYVLRDLEGEPYLAQYIIVRNLPTICSEENLAESFREVSYVNSSHVEQWVSTVELLAKIQYIPAINVICSMLYAEDECSREALDVVARLHLDEAIDDLKKILSIPHRRPPDVAHVLSLFLIDSTLPLLSKVRDQEFAALNLLESQFFQCQGSVERVQVNCKFYNYEIFHSPPTKPQPTQPDTLATIATTIDTIDQRTKQMVDQPARTIHMSGSGNYIEKIEGGYHEHNYAPQANLKETEQLTQLLQKIRTSNPNATEEQIFDILLRGFQTMPQNNPQNWQNWQNILSLIFVGGVEGIKIVCPPAGIPIEVGRKLYDIYDRNRKQLPGA